MVAARPTFLQERPVSAASSRSTASSTVPCIHGHVATLCITKGGAQRAQDAQLKKLQSQRLRENRVALERLQLDEARARQLLAVEISKAMAEVIGSRIVADAVSDALCGVLQLCGGDDADA